MSDELRVLDELERRLIAGCFGSAMAAEQASRRRRLWLLASRLASTMAPLGIGRAGARGGCRGSRGRRFHHGGAAAPA